MLKPMDLASLRTATPTELQRLLTERQAELHSLSFKVATRALTKVRELRRLRRDIAQIMTILRRHTPSA